MHFKYLHLNNTSWSCKNNICNQVHISELWRTFIYWDILRVSKLIVNNFFLHSNEKGSLLLHIIVFSILYYVFFNKFIEVHTNKNNTAFYFHKLIFFQSSHLKCLIITRNSNLLFIFVPTLKTYIFRYNRCIHT